MYDSRPYNRKIDWPLVVAYFALIGLGWFTIYSAGYNEMDTFSFDLSSSYGRQLFWIPVCLLVAFFILIIDVVFFTGFSFGIYFTSLIVLFIVLFIGQEVHGAKSWLVFGPVKVQPAEFAKFTTALMLARFISRRTFNFGQLSSKLIIALIVLAPTILILLQNDTGSMLAFSAFLLVLYREGMSPIVLVMAFAAVSLALLALLVPSLLNILLLLLLLLALIYLFYISNQKDNISPLFSTILKASYFISFSISMIYWLGLIDTQYLQEAAIGLCVLIIVSALIQAFIMRNFYKNIRSRLLLPLLIAGLSFTYTSSVDFVFNNILKPHQKSRIEVLIGLKHDPSGVGFHGIQSRMAIGSGGITGKGFLEGTRTRGKFVPEQSTDFIFCTIGEEHGFLGSFLVILLYMFFMLRIISLSERQRSSFSRVYGYSVACVFFVHFAINIGMVIGK
jgi:rod shape determining protein RodA